MLDIKTSERGSALPNRVLPQNQETTFKGTVPLKTTPFPFLLIFLVRLQVTCISSCVPVRLALIQAEEVVGGVRQHQLLQRVTKLLREVRVLHPTKQTARLHREEDRMMFV